MFDAFLSYSQSDGKFATRFQRRLESAFLSFRRLRIFRDLDDLGATPNLTRTIKGALEDSGALIALCTPNSVKRPKWLNIELEHYWNNATGDILLLVLSDEYGGKTLTWDVARGKPPFQRLPNDCMRLLPSAAHEILSDLSTASSHRRALIVFGPMKRSIQIASIACNFICRGSRSAFLIRYIVQVVAIWFRRLLIAIAAVVVPLSIALVYWLESGPYGGEFWSDHLELRNVWVANMDISIAASYGAERLQRELLTLGLEVPKDEFRFYTTEEGDRPSNFMLNFLDSVVVCYIENVNDDCSSNQCRISAAEALYRQLEERRISTAFIECVKDIRYKTP